MTIVSSLANGSCGIGCGFFVALGGYVLTNNHVIDDAQKLSVETSDGKSYPAKVIAHASSPDSPPDLALLKIELTEHPVLKIGDSDKVETGQAVYAIGSPEGYRQSFADGMISNADRIFRGNKVFQMNVLINHGNSGGPLIDETGLVVGINTFGLGTASLSVNGVDVGSDIQGINYAIKINEAKEIILSNTDR